MLPARRHKLPLKKRETAEFSSSTMEARKYENKIFNKVEKTNK